MCWALDLHTFTYIKYDLLCGKSFKFWHKFNWTTSIIENFSTEAWRQLLLTSRRGAAPSWGFWFLCAMMVTWTYLWTFVAKWMFCGRGRRSWLAVGDPERIKKGKETACNSLSAGITVTVLQSGWAIPTPILKSLLCVFIKICWLPLYQKFPSAEGTIGATLPKDE